MNTKKFFYGLMTLAVLALAACSGDSDNGLYDSVDKSKITKGPDGVDKSKITKGPDAVDKSKITKGPDAVDKSKITKGPDGK